MSNREAIPLSRKVYNRWRIFFVRHRLPLKSLSDVVEKEFQVELLKNRVLDAEAKAFPTLRRTLESADRSTQLTLL